MKNDEGAMGARQWEAIGVYGRWAIDITSPPVASEIIGIRTLNRGVIIPFFVFLF